MNSNANTQVPTLVARKIAIIWSITAICVMGANIVGSYTEHRDKAAMVQKTLTPIQERSFYYIPAI